MSFYRKARLKSMRDKMMRFLQGRYGVDALSKCLLGIGLIAVILAGFFGGKAVGNVLYILGWAAIIYCYFRIFSKNITKRYAENQKYLAKTYKLRSFFYKQKELMKQRKKKVGNRNSDGEDLTVTKEKTGNAGEYRNKVI